RQRHSQDGSYVAGGELDVAAALADIAARGRAALPDGGVRSMPVDVTELLQGLAPDRRVLAISKQGIPDPAERVQHDAVGVNKVAAYFTGRDVASINLLPGGELP